MKKVWRIFLLLLTGFGVTFNLLSMLANIYLGKSWIYYMLGVMICSLSFLRNIKPKERW